MFRGAWITLIMSGVLGMGGIARAQTEGTPSSGAAVQPTSVKPGETPPATSENPDLVFGEEIRDLLSAERLDALIAETKESALTEEAKASQIAMYEAIKASLKQSAELVETAQGQQILIDNATQELEQIRSELASPPRDVALPELSDATADQLEDEERQATANLNQARQNEQRLLEEKALRAQRKEQIPALLAQARSELQEIEENIVRASVPPLDPAAATAGRDEKLRLLADRRYKKAFIAGLEVEQRFISARAEVLDARISRAARRTLLALQVQEKWQTRLANARQREAVEAERAARERLAEARPEIKDVAKIELRLRELNTTYNAKLNDASQQLTRRQQQVLQHHGEFKASLRQSRSTGRLSSIGRLLHKKRTELPSPRQIRLDTRAHRQEINDALDVQIEVENIPNIGTDVALSARAILANIEEDLSDADRAEIENQLVKLLEIILPARARLLDTLTQFNTKLTELEQQESLLVEIVNSYTRFIDERIIWVRNTQAIGPRDITSSISAVPPLILADRVEVNEVSMPRWRLTAKSILDEFLDDPATIIPRLLTLAVLVVMIASRRRMRLSLHALSDELKCNKLEPSFRPTFEALGVTLVMAGIIPCSIAWVGWTLLASPADPNLLTIVDGLFMTAGSWFLFNIVLYVARPRGLAASHFRWPDASVKGIRRHVLWLRATLLPLIFLITAASEPLADVTADEEAARESLARLAFMASMIAVTVFSVIALRPSGGMVAGYLSRHRGEWLDRMNRTWYALAILFPALLFILAGLGYFYSARRLEFGMHRSIIFITLVVLIYALFNRWLDVARRRVAIEQAMQRKAAAAEAQAESDASEASTPKANPTTDSGGTDSQPAIDENAIDLPGAYAQAIQFFRSVMILALIVGLWTIWINVLPTLGAINRIQLYPEFGTVQANEYLLPEVDAAGAIRTPSKSTSDDGSKPANPASNSESNDSAATNQGSSNSESGKTGSTSSPLPGPGSLTPGSSNANGNGSDVVTESIGAITVGHVGIAFLIGFVTWIATRNLPGLMEIVLLQRLPLDTGSRYAISTILRYLLILIGVMIAFSAVGIGWSKMQWLAAALTFGLAFGLQEIFANFISGLILLMERPMRVGDIVTVGDVSGTVTRIRMRATTILDFARKELVVPNKEFITGRIVNWTLSDPVLRLDLNVGIAYGSDIAKARRTLMKIARANKNVLDDPSPQVVFMGFGDSTLNFQLRLFLPHVDRRVETMDTVHEAIDREFRKAGIEIAFPQRDLHLRSVEAPLQIERRDPQGKGTGGKNEG